MLHLFIQPFFLPSKLSQAVQPTKRTSLVLFTAKLTVPPSRRRSDNFAKEEEGEKTTTNNELFPSQNLEQLKVQFLNVSFV